MTHLNRHTLGLTILFLLIFGALAPGNHLRAGAQTPTAAKGEWSPPTNLSQSGGAGSPRFVIDATGVTHVVWMDEIQDATYTRFDGESWSPPASPAFPFKDNVPTLISSEGFIHVFWIEAGRDSTLQHIRVTPQNFGNPRTWEKPRTISKSVSSFDVHDGGGGRIHLVMIRNAADDTHSEGVYYRGSTDEGATWAAESLLHPSRYYRLLKSGDIDLHIESSPLAEADVVSVVWDHPTLKRVYYARSADGGATWEPLVEVDGPVGEDLSGSPFRITHTADGETALRVWQSNLQSGLFCTTYYQVSTDAGKTWSERRAILQNVNGCPADKRLYPLGGGNILLQTTVQSQLYLAAFDGERWSEPQVQPGINSFTNPLTGDTVELGCIQSIHREDGRLYIIGCDRGAGGDIWYASRAVDGIDLWFPHSTNWSEPKAVADTPDRIDRIQSSIDRQGRMHLFWTQHEPTRSTDPGPTALSLYHVLWDGEQASPANVVVRSLDKEIGDFSTAYDSSRNRVVAAWTGAVSGGVYYSWADANLASSVLEWADAITVPTPQALVRSPDIVVNAEGVVHIVYTVPINEGRGIYLVTSGDGEKTWSVPTQLFTFDNTDWQAIGLPRLALGSDNRRHLVWTRNDPFKSPSAYELYYARSEPGGGAWSEPQIASNAPVSDVWLVNTGANGLHRIWLTIGADAVNVFHDISPDGGASWSLPTDLSGLGETPRAVSPFIGENGHLSLVQIIEDQNKQLTLKILDWDGQAWKTGDSILISDAAGDEVGALSAGAGSDGRLLIGYSIKKANDVGVEEQPWEIIAISRFSNGSGNAQPSAAAPTAAPTAASPQPSPVETLAPQPEAATEQAAPPPTGETPTPPPVETEASDSAPTNTPPVPLDSTHAPTDSPTLGLILAGGIALLVVGVFYAMSRMRMR